MPVGKDSIITEFHTIAEGTTSYDKCSLHMWNQKKYMLFTWMYCMTFQHTSSWSQKARHTNLHYSNQHVNWAWFPWEDQLKAKPVNMASAYNIQCWLQEKAHKTKKRKENVALELVLEANLLVVPDTSMLLLVYKNICSIRDFSQGHSCTPCYSHAPTIIE